MKNTLLCAYFVLAACLVGDEIRIRAIDERGVPVVGASAAIIFTHAVTSYGLAHRGTTDDEGYFTAYGRAQRSVYVTVENPGYYSAILDLRREQNFDLPVVLPRVVHPIPLYARSPGAGDGLMNLLKFPLQDEWLGFDFVAGDWTKPYGKGQSTDIRFRFHGKFEGWFRPESEIAAMKRHPVSGSLTEEEFRAFYGKFSGTLDISFPNEHEGLVEVKEGFLAYSALKMPHQAPVDGYLPTLHSSAIGGDGQISIRTDMGYFIRTRVKLDEAGRIVSANYAKTHGNFFLWPQGSLTFFYYFNPTPNDRNLEFDPRRNLFPGGKADGP